MTEIMENAGATVLSAGSYMPPKDVAKSLADYHVNILAGDSSHVVQTVYHISLMAKEDRDRVRLDKIIYTSEPLTGPQRAFIKTILGEVKIISVMGSAEAGPWAISSPDLTGEQSLTSNSTDFVIDTRNMVVEIVSPSVIDGVSTPNPILLPQGEEGLIVQTSLQRLRNPLVRYVTGDIGSLHPLPSAACAVIPEADWGHLRVLRMHGRDPRFSFKWFGGYFEFDRISAFMQEEECGILQWQILLGRLESSPQATLEIRLLRSPLRDGILSDDALIKRVEAFFIVLPENEPLFRIAFLDGLGGFERSATAGKVIKFVNQWD
jgi:phenylacetate-coenzyme A ligase PaaK-like adenylate-forming protein